MPDQSLQERYAPDSICFGCGPANPEGLHIRSFAASDLGADPDAGKDGSECVCDWTPSPHHDAFPGTLNGGMIGTLMDCHSNWTAARHLMRQAGATKAPTTVTADYHVRLRKPTPSDRPVHVRAWVVESTADRATIDAEMSSGGVVTATCRGLFVAVRPGHPAYERW